MMINLWRGSDSDYLNAVQVALQEQTGRRQIPFCVTESGGIDAPESRVRKE
jgi:hypothetical protein